MSWGIRYLVVAVGTPDDKAKDEDVAMVEEVLSEVSPFKVTTLSDEVSDKLTLALLQERGLL